MKLSKSYIFAGFFSICLVFMMASCKTGEGCPTIDKYSTEVNLNSKKRGKSNLFSKKQKKKMRKAGQG